MPPLESQITSRLLSMLFQRMT